MTDQNRTGVHRRAFLLSVGTVSAAAAASPAAAGKSGSPKDDGIGTGYQPNSDHVKAFYRTNGYETLKK